MDKVISVDFFADFGFFKKPFSNEKLDLYLTFNMLHKPAMLGILGSILGLSGYKKNRELPEHYEKLKSLRVGIEPIEKNKAGRILHENGIFPKTNVKYNNAVGYANETEYPLKIRGGTILNIHEQIIVAPAYKCYILFDNSIELKLQSKLAEYLKNSYAEYLPYFGKNEFSCWWEKESYKEYELYDIDKDNSFAVDSIFYLTESSLKESKSSLSVSDFFNTEKSSPYAYFERLPIGFTKVEDSYQYEIEKFIYSNFKIRGDAEIDGLYMLKSDNNTKYVQFF